MKAQQQRIEQLVIQVNRDAKAQLEREPEIELQMIDEFQWQIETKDQYNLFKVYNGSIPDDLM